MLVPALLDLALDPALQGAPARVYLYLLHQLDGVEYRPVKAWGLAGTLKIQSRTASAALKLLAKKGYLDHRVRPAFPSSQIHEYRIHYARHDAAAVAPPPASASASASAPTPS